MPQHRLLAPQQTHEVENQPPPLADYNALAAQTRPRAAKPSTLASILDGS